MVGFLVPRDRKLLTNTATGDRVAPMVKSKRSKKSSEGRAPTDIRFAMMLSSVEDAILQRAAKKEGLSKAGVVRKLIRSWVLENSPLRRLAKS